MILAIDFDGVLHDSENITEGHKLGKPIPGAVEAMKELASAGHTLIIHSVKPAEVIRAWVRFFRVPFDDIVRAKPIADVYLDDKAIRFTSWRLALAEIRGIDKELA